jgi:hypothetical protein
VFAGIAGAAKSIPAQTICSFFKRLTCFKALWGGPGWANLVPRWQPEWRAVGTFTTPTILTATKTIPAPTFCSFLR